MPVIEQTVQPEKILKDLRKLWDELGREKQTAGGVLRACAMTLVVTAEDEGSAEDVRKIIGTLMHAHPSRAIVLHLNRTSDLSARVFAECWMPFGRHQQICSEGIEITAGTDRLTDVAQVLLPLLVPDLPVVLWTRGASAFVPHSYEALYPLAQKIILDSADAPDASAAIEKLRSMRHRGMLVADLAWTRLTGWREVMAHFFDENVVDSRNVTSVRVSHGGSGTPSTCAWYLSEWIRKCLPAAQVSLDPEPGPAGLRSLIISAGSQDFTVSLSKNAVDINAGSHQCRSLMPASTEDALMREELSIIGPDPVFDRVIL